MEEVLILKKYLKVVLILCFDNKISGLILCLI